MLTALPPPLPVSFYMASKVQCTSTNGHTVRCRQELCARCCQRGMKKMQQPQVVCIGPRLMTWICQCVVVNLCKVSKHHHQRIDLSCQVFFYDGQIHPPPTPAAHLNADQREPLHKGSKIAMRSLSAFLWIVTCNRYIIHIRCYGSHGLLPGHILALVIKQKRCFNSVSP